MDDDGSMSTPARDRRHVVIAGGGVAAVEALLALRALAGHRIEITMLSPERDFLYRPVTVAEAFDRAEARAYDLSEIVAHGGARVVWDALAAVDPHDRAAVTAGGERIPFDSLLVATGASPAEPLPGALTFRGRDDVPALRSLLEELVYGRARSVALALPVRSDVDAADLRACPYDRGASTRARGRCRRGVARDARGGATRTVWTGGRGRDQAPA